MKPIAWILFAVLCLLGCSGTDFAFGIADSTADVSDPDRKDASAGTDARQSSDATLEEAEGAVTLPDTGPQPDVGPRDASRDTAREAALDAAIRDATRDDSREGGDAQTDGPPDTGVVTCIPNSKLAACSNAQCGTVSDGCSGSYTCGTCSPTKVCTANTCGCPTVTDARYCLDHGYNCGSVVDTCSGLTRSCGGCSGRLTCGGGGKANVCGCTPLTSCPLGDDCGLVPNQCGGVLSCGSCSGFDKCGAQTPNHCGCVPLLACPDPSRCGPMSDGCGGTVNCMACSPGQICGSVGAPDGGADAGFASCPPNVCCNVCTPTQDPNCMTQAISCDPSFAPPGCTAFSPADGGASGDGGGNVLWCCP